MKDEKSGMISMVDSNLFRETIRPSEKAFAYKMKYEAIKRKSGRKNGGQIDYHLLGKRTIDIIGEDSGESPKQVQRFMKLTDLIPELQEMLDEGAIAFNPAYEIAFLTEEEQKDELYEDQLVLSPEDQEKLDRRFGILHNLTYNSRMARANKVQVTVTYYEP